MITKLTCDYNTTVHQWLYTLLYITHTIASESHKNNNLQQEINHTKKSNATILVSKQSRQLSQVMTTLTLNTSKLTEAIYLNNVDTLQIIGVGPL